MKEKKHERKKSVTRMICQACSEGRISLECSKEKFDRYCQCDVNILQIIMGEVFYPSPWQGLQVTLAGSTSHLLSPTQYSILIHSDCNFTTNTTKCFKFSNHLSVFITENGMYFWHSGSSQSGTRVSNPCSGPHPVLLNQNLLRPFQSNTSPVSSRIIYSR